MKEEIGATGSGAGRGSIVYTVPFSWLGASMKPVSCTNDHLAVHFFDCTNR